MYLLLVFLSITGSCLSGLFGRYLGSFGASIITTSCLFLSFLIALFFYEVALANCLLYIQQLPPWRRFEVLNVDWAFMLDILTVTMYVVVTFIITHIKAKINITKV